MVAALNAAYDEGHVPNEVLEFNLMEMFGWTQQQLDRQDFARLWRSMSAAKVYRAARKTIHRERLDDGESQLFNSALQWDYEASRQ